MFGSTTLDVAIGLTYLFVMLSLVATALREAIEAVLKTRAIQLEAGIRTLLSDEVVPKAVAAARQAAEQAGVALGKTAAEVKADVVAVVETATKAAKVDEKTQKAVVPAVSITSTLFEHPLLYGLFKGDYAQGSNTLTPSFLGGRVRARFMSNLPSYVPSRSFATALLDTIGRGPVQADEAALPPISFEQVRAGLDAGIDRVPINPHLKRALTIALDEAGGDLDKARRNVEAWFDSGMERVSGWYKRETQWILLAIGLFLAVAGNVDAISVAQGLGRDDQLRQAIVERAIAAPDPQSLGDTDWRTLAAQTRALDYPIGWNQPWSWTMPLGWLITAFAVSLGAPFWFDVLAKVMSIRSSKPPKEEPVPAASGVPTDAGIAADTAVVQALTGAAAGFEPQRWAASAGRSSADEGVL